MLFKMCDAIIKSCSRVYDKALDRYTNATLKFPLTFILTSILICLGCIVGAIVQYHGFIPWNDIKQNQTNLKFVNQAFSEANASEITSYKMYFLEDSETDQDRDTIDMIWNHQPLYPNFSMFNPWHLRIILTVKQQANDQHFETNKMLWQRKSGNIFTEEYLQLYLKFYDTILKTEKPVSFHKVCQRNNYGLRQCYENPFVKVLKSNIRKEQQKILRISSNPDGDSDTSTENNTDEDIESQYSNSNLKQLIKLRYPTTCYRLINTTTDSKCYKIGRMFGGVQIDEENYIHTAQAIHMEFHVKIPQSNAERSDAKLWLHQTEELLRNLSQEAEFSAFNISWWSTEKFEKDLESVHDTFGNTLPYLVIPLFLYALLNGILFYKCNCQQMAYTLPFAGLLSTILAAITTYCCMKIVTTTPTTSLLLLVPILTTAQGLRLVHFIRSIWRITTSEDRSVKEKLTICLNETLPVIFMISFIDLIMYCWCILNRISIIRQMWTFSAAGIAINLFYMFTVFIPTLVVTSQSLTLKSKIICGKSSDNTLTTINKRSFGRQMLNHIRKPQRSEHNVIDKFFEIQLSSFLLHPVTQTLVILIYVTYLSMAGWGCVSIKINTDLQSLVNTHSNSATFLNNLDEYFNDNYHYATLLFNTSHSSRGPGLSHKLQQIAIQNLSNTKFTDQVLNEEYWLNRLAELTKIIHLDRKYQLAITKSEDSSLISILRAVQYEFPDFRSQLQSQTRFGHSSKYPLRYQILANRVQIPLKEMKMSDPVLTTAIKYLRNTAKMNQLSTTIYSDIFSFADTAATILPNIIETIAATMLCTCLLVALLIHKNVLTLAAIMVSICSTIAGVIGFMPLFNIHCIQTSITGLVFDISFTSYYHIMFGYMWIKASPKGSSVATRLRATLYRIGVPFLDTLTTSVLVISPILFIDAKVIENFVKLGLLGVIITCLHALIFLPVLLSLFQVARDHGAIYLHQNTNFLRNYFTLPIFGTTSQEQTTSDSSSPSSTRSTTVNIEKHSDRCSINRLSISQLENCRYEIPRQSANFPANNSKKTKCDVPDDGPPYAIPHKTTTTDHMEKHLSLEKLSKQEVALSHIPILDIKKFLDIPTEEACKDYSQIYVPVDVTWSDAVTV